MTESLRALVELLDLEPLEQNLFRGQSRNLGGRSVFGGQVVAQSLIAAYRTLDDQEPRVAHSLHAYFLRPGDMNAPIIYDVDRIRDGKSFTTRRINAIQHGRPIFTMIASFQREEDGLEHQLTMPDVPAPETLRDQMTLREEWSAGLSEKLRSAYLRPLPIEFRPINPRNPFQPNEQAAEQQIWFRAAEPITDDPAVHQAVMTYATDFHLLGTALLPHGVSYFKPKMAIASLDHALWFHRCCRADDWLLYVMDAPGSQGARGFSRGSIFSRDGKLVASAAQESLMRVLED